MREEIKGGKYQHYKGGFYEIIGIGTHSETGEKLIIYKSLNDNQLWIRPKTIFLEDVVVNGEKTPRFKFISD